MVNAGQKIFPPLRIWIFLFISTMLIAALLFHLGRLKTQYDFDAKSRYVSQGFARARGKPVVLVIGTSLTECGLDSSGKIEGCVEELSGKAIVLLKVFKRGAILSEIIDHMKSLCQTQPDFVVVEANMLFYRPVQESILNRYGYSYLFHWLIERRSLRQPYFPDSIPSIIVTTKTAVDEGRNGLIDTSEISSFRDLATRWQSKGTGFLFINFPIEKLEESKKWNRSDTSAFNVNMGYLKGRIKMDYFNEGLELDSSFFYDHTHMNLKGRNIFSNSFCKELAFQMKSR